MNFATIGKAADLGGLLTDFMKVHVYPAEMIYHEQIGEERWRVPPIVQELKARARAVGLWNLFLPQDESGLGLTNLDDRRDPPTLLADLFLIDPFGGINMRLHELREQLTEVRGLSGRREIHGSLAAVRPEMERIAILPPRHS